MVFIEVEMKDILRVEPNRFDRDRRDEVMYMLNKKYSDRVISKIGLSIEVWDVLEVREKRTTPTTKAVVLSTYCSKVELI